MFASIAWVRIEGSTFHRPPWTSGGRAVAATFPPASRLRECGPGASGIEKPILGKPGRKKIRKRKNQAKPRLLLAIERL
jgi:hypothetical protein